MNAATIELLAEIDAFQAKRVRMSDATLGRRTCNDTALVRRMRAGGTISIERAKKVRDFIAQHSRLEGALAQPEPV